MDTKDVTRKLRAILSADVQGYSRLMGDDEVATVKTITEYRETISSLVSQYKGRVIDSPGDNVLAEFGSVVDAVQSAVEIQNVLKAKNEELPENRRMIFRIGVNLGDVIQEGDRIYGDGVNIAARIESLADGGGICISGTAYDHIENKLALGYNFVGEHFVKNIAKPVRVYKVPMEPGERNEKKIRVKKWQWAALAGILVLALAAGAFWNFYLRSQREEPASIEKMVFSLPDKPSIAVLAFTNMSGDPKQDYLCDGISEQIIASLSQVPGIFVIARNSSFTYKGKPVKVQQVSEELGVRNVLEGSVQISGDRIRITVQLIDAISGNHIWAEKLAKKALELDDSLGMPHRLLSEIYRVKKQWDNSLVEAERAVSIDPNSMNMYGLAMHLVFVGRHEESIAMMKKAFRLDPNPPAMYIRQLGIAYFLSEQYEKALAEYKRALRKEGFSPKNLHIGLAAIYAMLGQEEEARHHVAEVLKIDPKYSLKRATKRIRNFYKNQADADRWINALRKAGLPEEPPLPLPDKPSIAVLPFTNISADPEQEYFSDGMTDTLITDLSKISELFVIARNSVFTYKGKTVKVAQIGRELGVRYVMEGSVQKAKNQVRINAQLIDTKTGGHLWAERYDGKMDDIFALQDEIIGKIVSALAVKLTASEKKQLGRKYTDNIEAYDAFLKGEGHFLRWTPEDLRKAIPYLKKAIKLDPNYGRANAVLGIIYWFAPSSWTGVKWPIRTLMARNCLELALKNPDSYAHQLAAYNNLQLREYKNAVSEAERALVLAPNDHGAQGVMADALISSGRPKEAVEYAEFEMRHDPRRIHFGLSRLGKANFNMGELEQAATYFKKTLTHTEFIDAYLFLAATYAHLGREKKAREALENYYGTVGWKPSLRALMYWYPFKDPGVAERFADGLLKAGMKGEPSGYPKILEENRLSGEEIRKLVFGREFCTSCMLLSPLQANRTKDGTIMDGKQAVGKSRIDGDMLCDKWNSRFEGLEYCGTVFRNPEGTSDAGDEYFYVTDFQICRLSPAEGKQSGSSRILEEDRLSGEEIKKLLFGRTRTTIREGGYQYWVECSKDGKKTKFWSDSGWTDNGKSWLEGDLYCVQWEKIADGVKICFHIYRNPEGTPEKQDEYFLLGKDGIIPWSLVD